MQLKNHSLQNVPCKTIDLMINLLQHFPFQSIELGLQRSQLASNQKMNHNSAHINVLKLAHVHIYVLAIHIHVKGIMCELYDSLVYE